MRGGRRAAVAAALLLLGCDRDRNRPRDPLPDPAELHWLVDVTAVAGVDFVHRGFAGERRYWLPEIMGGGACWLDADGDGRLDLYLVQSGDLAGARPDVGNALFRNRGDGTFADVTAAAGVGDPGYGMGCTAGDYDGDGDDDLYVTNVGGNVLYRNDSDRGEPGGVRFTDVTQAAGVGDASWGTSAGLLDYDGDGDLDLFVVNYIRWSPQREVACQSASRVDYCSPKTYRAPARDVLYRNDGDGSFNDVTAAAGIDQRGNGLGFAAGDFDGDGSLDVYVANDGNPNHLWLGDGAGRFTEQAVASGVAVNLFGAAEAGMGVAVDDLGDDGKLDLFITHLNNESNTLYRGAAELGFDDVTTELGLAAPSLSFTGFGTGFVDFDNDGTLDVHVGNGRVVHRPVPLAAADPYAEPNQLFHGRAGGGFAELFADRRGLVENSRATAYADYDGDGDVDVAVVNNGGRARLLRNRTGGAGNWVAFRVLEAGGVDALGATIAVESGGVTRRRLVKRAYSYCASHDPRVHVGLGPADAVERVVVHWQGRPPESFGPFAAGASYVLRAGDGGPNDR